MAKKKREVFFTVEVPIYVDDLRSCVESFVYDCLLDDFHPHHTKAAKIDVTAIIDRIMASPELAGYIKDLVFSQGSEYCFDDWDLSSRFKKSPAAAEIKILEVYVEELENKLVAERLAESKKKMEQDRKDQLKVAIDLLDELGYVIKKKD